MRPVEVLPVALLRYALLPLWAVACMVTTVAGAEAPAGPDFSGEIAPLLARHCIRCHGADEAQAGLRLDGRQRAFQGGDSGATIVPGKSGGSLLIDRVASADPDVRMPPAGEQPLAAAEIDLLRRWIDAGAAWPEDADGEKRSHPHWAFHAPIRPEVPAVRNEAWARGPVDRFVLARLEAEGLEPLAEADRTTLIRRLHLDLVGLPPAPETVARYADDPQPDWYERLVEELLASPHYGERWGRHWLDLARYADSDGNSGEKARPNAWRYRDWVIEAFNRDLAFDQFTIEQLAGDLLPDAGVTEKTAAGFHRNARSSRETCLTEEDKHVRGAYDRTIATGEIWLGLTVACVQCHSHKYDPLSQRDFFGLYAFFDNVEEVDVPVGQPESDTAAIPTLREREDGRRTTYVHLRGNFLDRGPEVQPHTFGVLPPLAPRGGVPDRLDLARWLVDERNPLTARVAVNRIWLGLFGAGIVATVNDFGTRGDPPSHPELLDWMADEFVASGWSRKGMIRRIVHSATYRQSSRHRPDLADRDPKNKLLARQNRFRLEGEVIRDAALTVAGRMTSRVGGPSFRPPVPHDAGSGTLAEWSPASARDEDRRSLYIFIQRTVPHPLLAALDIPDGNFPCLMRNRSNTPVQALTTMNDPLFFGYARAAGARLAASGGSFPERAENLFLLALGRKPTRHEAADLATLYGAAEETLGADDDAGRRLAGLSDTEAATSQTVEQAAWVVLAQTVMNLDEFLTRE